MRKQLVSGKKLLLFVDTGDNCRCPLAIGYLSKLLAQKNIDYIELRHMGVMTPNDLLPTPEVVQLLKEEGVDIRIHRSRPVNDDLIRAADLVLGFTAIHVQTCLRRVPESKGKVSLLKQYVGLGASGDQIHDPMGSTMEIFKKYFAEIKQSLHKLMEMEFITTPPEPKEVLIAPSVSKPRSMGDEPADEESSRKSRPRKGDAVADDGATAKTRAAAAAAEDDSPKPVKAKKSPGVAKDKVAKPEKKSAAAESEKPAKAKAAKADVESSADDKAEAKVAKAKKDDKSKAASVAEKPKAAKAAAKAADKPVKAAAKPAAAVKAKPAEKKAAKPAKADAAPAKAVKTKK